jgi:predicted NBD/HSP70 family sugar kinase
MYHHPSQLRVANLHRIFRMLLARGACSRAELARLSGLSAVTAGKVVDALLEEGLIEEVDARSALRASAGSDGAAMGRPPHLVGVSSAVLFPVVEIGAVTSSIRLVSLAQAARADLDLALSASEPIHRFATPRSTNAFIAEAERAKTALGIHQARAILVSMPGVLSGDGMEVVFSPNLRWTNGRELLQRLARTFAAPVCAVQEIQALALGHLAGSTSAAPMPESSVPNSFVPSSFVPSSFVLVDFGDGVGGAVVTGGQLLHGPQPLCGEIGHTAVFGNRRRCGCGAVGCLETLVSCGGVLQSYRAAKRKPRATWSECARHIAARGVESWLAPPIDAAATVIAGALNLIGAADLVLTGDLPALHPEVLVAFERRVQEHALVGRFARLTCHLAPRRRILGLVVAAASRMLLPEPSLPVAEAV